LAANVARGTKIIIRRTVRGEGACNVRIEKVEENKGIRKCDCIGKEEERGRAN
jgi:hypothetical protein